MSLNTVLIIVGVVLSVLCVIGWIDWQALFFRIYGNNPDKGKVYVESGYNVELYMARRDPEFKSSFGDLYRYHANGEAQVVIVPFWYAERYHMGRRMIRVEDGVSIAAPFGDDTPPEAQQGQALMAAMYLNNTVVRLQKTFVMEKSFNWMTAIIAVAVIGGLALLWQTGFFDGLLGNQPTTEPIPSQSMPPDLEEALREQS